MANGKVSEVRLSSLPPNKNVWFAGENGLVIDSDGKIISISNPSYDDASC